jgi:hypothetical protein
MMRNIFKSLLPLLYVVACGFSVSAQASKQGASGFDIPDFNKKFEIVKWLVAYDTVAWKTTDVMLASDKVDLARLGKEWFCFQDRNGLWHAVYGKLENDKFDQVFHYVVDTNGTITRTNDKLDAALLVRYARALDLAIAKLSESVPPDSPRHNSYVKQNTDRTFTVWLLPAFQPNSLAVFGGEFVYTIDSEAGKITRDDSYFQGAFRAFNVKPPREIWLNYREKDKPTLGSIFFVWYYREYFTKVFIDNSSSTSSLIKNGSEYTWLHVVKDKKDARTN